MAVRTNTRFNRSPLTLALAAAMLLPAGVAMAQSNEAQQQEQPDEQQEEAPKAATAAADTTLEKVVVTGSRIKKVDVEGPAPVTIITAEEIQAQGFNTVYEAINTLSQNDTGQLQNELSAGSFTQGAQFINLRGMGPGYQLVLINGRRAADYPHPYNGQSNAVNIGSIPAAAIDRIEVLTGGASAIYGSDAVAGVVNVVLKTNYEGDAVSLRGGTTTDGGGDSLRLQWVGGKTKDSWSLNYAFEYLKRDTIWASQRDFMDSYRDDPTVDPSGFVPAVEGVRLTYNGIRVWPDGFEETCARFKEFEAVVNPAAAPNNNQRCYYYGYPATQTIRNKDDNYSAYLYGTYDFDNGTQAWGQFSYVSSEIELAMGSQFISGNLGGGYAIQRIFTQDELGGRSAQAGIYKEQTYDIAAGLRGTMIDDKFDWDATLSHSRYYSDSHQPWFLADRLLGYFFTENGFDLDRYFNPMSPETYQGLIGDALTKGESQVTQAQFTISGDLFELPAGPVGFAAVVEAASQKYSLKPDERLLPSYQGDDYFWNLTATGGGGSRDRYALGVETSIPVFSTLKASLAARIDKYDDITQVDNAFTWNAGLEWRPLSNLLLRASHSTSFRAPDMHWVYAEESGFYTNIFDEYRFRRDGFDPNDDSPETDAARGDYVYQVFGTRQGDPGLHEEEGTSTTAGLVWDVRDDLSVSLDWYRIKLEGSVADLRGYLFREEAACLLGTDRNGDPVDSNSTACQHYINQVARDPGADDEVAQFSTYPINQAMAETSGIDASVTYGLDTDRLGDFNFRLSWSHVLKNRDQLFDGEPIRELRDNKQFFNFRSRMNWQVGWKRDSWSANLYGYRWGSLPNWAETGRIAPFIVWNASASKEFNDKFKVSVLVNNLLDKHHPADDTFYTYPFFWGAFDAIGREVFVQLDYKF